MHTDDAKAQLNGDGMGDVDGGLGGFESFGNPLPHWTSREMSDVIHPNSRRIRLLHW